VKVGVTGHQALEDPQGWNWVRAELGRVLADLDLPLVGLTSLAVGADSMFAELVLLQGGSFEAILPFPEYEQKFHARNRERYQHLLETASRVTILRRKRSDEESYFEAGKRVVDMAELLLAVWDGLPAKGLGGTADIVTYATQQRKEVIHLDPCKRLVTRLKPPAELNKL
jgi:hypothetical protein